jgi:hypothetical protein
MRNPVRTQTFDTLPYRIVEWKLHDKCNYNCSFCGDEHKLGLIGWKDFEENKRIIDSIAKACEGKPYWIQLTGGEPTLYPKLIELMQYMREKGAMVRMISNGSRTIRWWTRLRDAKVIDSLLLTFHSQQEASYSHLAEVSNLFHDEPTDVINLVTCVASSVDLALEGTEYLIENTGSMISMNAMDLVDSRVDETTIGVDRFERLKEYSLAYGKLIDTKTPPTIPKEYMQALNTIITYDDGSSEEKDVTLMMKTGENQFKDWYCEAGIDSMNIEVNVKSRGGCRRDPTPFDPDTLSFFDKPFKCDVKSCYCAKDMILTKYI